MRPRHILIATLAVAAFVLARGDAEASVYSHARNGGFEAGTVGWNADLGTALTSVDAASAPPAEGAHSLRVTFGDGAFSFSQDLPLALPAGDYQVSARVRSQFSARIALALRTSEPGFSRSSMATDTSGGEWTAVDGVGTISRAARVRLLVTGTAPNGGEIFVDDIRVEGAAPVVLTPTPLPTSTPAAPFQTGTAVAASDTPLPSLPTETPAANTDAIAPHLRNAGFESTADNGTLLAWHKYGGELTPDWNARTGHHAARLVSATTSTKWLQQAVTVDSAAWYEFSAWILADDAGIASAFLRISWYTSEDASGEAIDTTDSLSRLTEPSSAYRHITTGSAQAPDGASSARAKIMLAPVSGTSASILVDDASFDPADPPIPAADGQIATGVAQGPRDAGARYARSQSHPATTVNIRPAQGVAAPIVINEVLYDATGDGADVDNEWVELFNPGDEPVDLTGWMLADGSSVDVVPSVVILPRGFAIIAASDTFAATYPGYHGPAAFIGRIGNGLRNDGDALELRDPTGAVVDAMSWGDNTTIFDPPIEDVPAGHSLQRAPSGFDTDTMADFIDNEWPNPGAGSESVATKPQLANSSSVIELLSPAPDRNLDWLPWALTALAGVALAATACWRTLESLLDRTPRL